MHQCRRYVVRLIERDFLLGEFLCALAQVLADRPACRLDLAGDAGLLEGSARRAAASIRQHRGMPPL